jgi:Glycosyl hydrolase family 47
MALESWPTLVGVPDATARFHREWGWEVFQSIEKYCRTGVGYGTLSTVQSRKGPPRDKMETFFLAETVKYMYLLQDPDTEVDILNKVFESISLSHNLLCCATHRFFSQCVFVIDDAACFQHGSSSHEKIRRARTGRIQEIAIEKRLAFSKPFGCVPGLYPPLGCQFTMVLAREQEKRA